MAVGKRTRFGLVFDGVKAPSMGGDFLKDMEVIRAEGCEKDGKHFVVLSVMKPRRPEEISESIRAYNNDPNMSDKMNLIAYENGPEVAVFDRGNCFKTHPICKVIQSMMTDDSYWEWGVVIDSERKKKRAVGELESDLVEASILPMEPKRASKKLLADAQVVLCFKIFYMRLKFCWNLVEYILIVLSLCQEDIERTDPAAASFVKKRKSIHRKTGSLMKGFEENAAKDVLVLLLKEVTRSKDETIQTKNQMIELLMGRKCVNCGNIAQETAE